MAFINEYVSKDNVDRYGLCEKFNRYRPFNTVDGEFEFSWVFDQEIDCFLMRTASGKFELSHQIEFILWVNGSEFSITLNKIVFEKSSGCKWSLENVESDVEFEYSIKDTIKVLKDALTVYGY